MEGPKERVISAIQRDRLVDFLKQSRKEKSGCFYYSLLITWNYLYPNKVLPRNTAKRILNLDTDLGAKPSQVTDKVKDIEGILGVSVFKVGIAPGTRQSEQEIRQLLELPKEIEIFKYKDENRRIEALNDESSAIIYLENDESGSHYISINKSERFQGIEKERGNIGGQEGADYVFDRGYQPRLVFHIRKKT